MPADKSVAIVTEASQRNGRATSVRLAHDFSAVVLAARNKTECLEQLTAQAPAGRPAAAEKIAEAIVFLVTDRASFIHGARLAVDGERTAV